MSFFRAPIRTAAPARARVSVFAVGRRVYIAGAGGRSARVTLTDGADRPLASLREGAEVTILAWLPNGGTTRYCVRVMQSGLEGWLPVGDLRGTKVAVSSPPMVPPPAARAGTRQARESGRSGRQFGRPL